MARIPRPNVPGGTFHLTTRLQGRAHLFTPAMRDRVVSLLARQAARSDVRLLAFVVMTNHLHLVLIQGGQPLSRLMQPLLRSVALAVQQAHGTTGHVFERRFRDHLCREPEHVRNAIAYTHANPVRAGLCELPSGYRWSSHGLYEAAQVPRRGPRVRVPLDLTAGLQAFLKDGLGATGARHEDARASYRTYIADVLQAPLEQSEYDVNGTGPYPVGGNDPALLRVNVDRELREIATKILRAQPGGVTLDQLRTRWGPRSRLRPRNEIGWACSQAGYSGRAIAAFLKISEPTVSRMLARSPRS